MMLGQTRSPHTPGDEMSRDGPAAGCSAAVDPAPTRRRSVPVRGDRVGWNRRW